ncbi:MAG TPA: 3-ketoacyl-ACP reductase [Verrucomicrobiota bacterium]|nr:3-ketoacyl-ACP reductase [Verrucomicrobiota bacterium]HNU52119.1 3-ketoacyl-ACP reductase [Verrucomicrobiota bacterium]
MNRAALITGASRGIGRGIARALASRGFDLMLNYVRNAAAADEASAACLEAAREAGHAIRVRACSADVAVAADRDRLLAEARSFLGPLDLLVSNAGVAPEVRRDVLETTEASFDRLMAVNVKGPFFLAQQAGREMAAEVGRRAAAGLGEAGDGVRAYRPRIVFISSLSAYTASVNRAEYCISKAALAMVTKLFAVRLAAEGVGVFEIRPGIVATDMTEPVRARYDALLREGIPPMRRWGTPEDIGRAVVAVAEDLLPFSTGEVLNVDGGFHLRQL